MMIRCFIDVKWEPVRRLFCGDQSWLQSPEGDMVFRPDTTYKSVEGSINSIARELTPAVFLAESRGMAIADKALELLAAERGAKCYYLGQWYLQTEQRDLYGKYDFDESRHPLSINSFEERHHRTVADLLASEPGKKHRQQIEEFILSLPVVGQETPEAEPVDPVSDELDVEQDYLIVTQHGKRLAITECFKHSLAQARCVARVATTHARLPTRIYQLVEAVEIELCADTSEE